MQVQTFNITMLCDEDYMVEPVALRFLVEHSFDFNKQYSQGVSYYRGQDKVSEGVVVEASPSNCSHKACFMVTAKCVQ